MAFLLPYRDDFASFDMDRVQRALVDFGCMHQRATPSYPWVFNYTSQTDNVTVEIPGNSANVIIDHFSETGVAIALAIQKHCKTPIHIVDEGYTFDFVLTDFKTPEELWHAALDAGA